MVLKDSYKEKFLFTNFIFDISNTTMKNNEINNQIKLCDRNN